MEEAKARNHPSVDWTQYFASIRSQCPWSYRAHQQGLIDVVAWQGVVHTLAPYQARVYVIDASDDQVEALARALDHGEDQWLFSYPGYGAWATPVSVLIQQNRHVLTTLRQQILSE